jgi:hypothetical protein
MEAEQRLREAIGRNIANNMELPDSQVARLSAVAFRYRDSSIVLRDREGYIRSQMRNEAGAARMGRVPSETRMACLVDAFYVTLREHINLRVSEDREVSQFLNPLRRYRYLSLQDRLHEIIDEAVGNMNRRFGPPGTAGGGPPVAGGAPPGNPPAGRVGPPPGGRGRGGGPPGGRQGPPGRGQFASLCPVGM